MTDTTTAESSRGSDYVPSALDQGILSLSRDMTSIIGFDGLFRDVNRVWEQVLGYTRAELIEQPFLDLVHPDDHDATREAMKSLSQGLPLVSFANRCRASDGAYRWIQTNAMPVDGEGQAYMVGFVDTERTLSQSEQLKAGALQRAIFNSANFSSIATDAKGVIQIFNVGAERMLGYTAAEVMNKITPADISDPQELIVRAKWLSAELATAITPGFEALVFKASRGIEDIYELTYIRKDGSRFPAVVSVTALRDAQDLIIGYLLIGTDNTARKVVEEEQKKSDQRLRDQQFYTRSLIESNIDALMTTDPSGIITDVNKQMEALTGSTRDELIGAPFKDCFTDRDRAEAAIKLVLSEKSVTDYELTARARDGTETVVSYNATTFYDRSRTLQGVFAAARDVTEQKRVELELNEARAVAESASQTKSDFLASMSHEIRTPMNAIMGIADLLAQTQLSATQDKYVKIFRRAGENLLNLINDILDLSKVEASQLELERTGFSLKEQTEIAIEMVTARAQEKGLTLTCDIAADVPDSVIGDPTRLRQILMNLLGNAIKFTASGTVSLRVDADHDPLSPTSLRFSVCDTGIGIPDEKQARVFERFTQADSSTTRRFGGSGLGLTICKRLVELMGGRIWVDSKVAMGSTFSFALPLEVENSSPRADAITEGASSELSLAPLRILLTEDSPDNCTITLAYLEGTPYVVEVAENGASACDMFRAAKYDLVLMDRQMPIMDGLEATRTIRAWEDLNGRNPTPIIALTASALKGDREMCMAAGCTAFLTKPIRQAVLLQAIREHTINAVVAPGSDVTLTPIRSTRSAERLALQSPKYLANCRENSSKMRVALDMQDLETVATLGHNLAGSGASFGFPVISAIGSIIQTTAEIGDKSGARDAIGSLAAFLDGVQPALPE
jgi:PAS domain S-box-containing protein